MSEAIEVLLTMLPITLPCNVVVDGGRCGHEAGVAVGMEPICRCHIVEGGLSDATDDQWMRFDACPRRETTDANS